MSPEPLTDEVWQVAMRVCTPGQIEALKLREAGLGYRRIAPYLGVSWETVRDRIARAEDAIERELRRQEAA